MRILLASHAYIVGINHRKLEHLAGMPDVDLHLLVPHRWKDDLVDRAPEKTTDPRYRISRTWTLGWGHLHLAFAPFFLWHLLRWRPQIVHIEAEPISLAALQGVIGARLLGARSIVFTWENIYKEHARRGWRYRPYGWVERCVLRRADFLIAGNAEAAGVLRRKGYRGPIAVLPQFGVDGDGEDAPRPLREGGEFTVGFVGRICREKGVLVLLEAFAGMPKGCRLLLVGRGPLDQEAREMAARWGIADRCQWAGGVPHAEVPGYLAQMDCLVLPSLTTPEWKEQFGHVLIEGMARGLPVVGSSCGEIPHVIGEAGIVVPEGDPQALRSALQGLRTSPGLRRSLGEAGRRRAAGSFSHRRVAEATWEIYRSLVAEARGTA